MSMTEEKAIDSLRFNRPFAHNELQDAVDVAIKAIEEIQAYRAIGTVEYFKSLKEKAEPKKAKATNYKAYCPNCNNLITDEIFLLDYAICHCKDCGQAIKGYWQ